LLKVFLTTPPPGRREVLGARSTSEVQCPKSKVEGEKGFRGKVASAFAWDAMADRGAMRGIKVF